MLLDSGNTHESCAQISGESGDQGDFPAATISVSVSGQHAWKNDDDDDDNNNSPPSSVNGHCSTPTASQIIEIGGQSRVWAIVLASGAAVHLEPRDTLNRRTTVGRRDADGKLAPARPTHTRQEQRRRRKQLETRARNHEQVAGRPPAGWLASGQRKRTTERVESCYVVPVWPLVGSVALLFLLPPTTNLLDSVAQLAARLIWNWLWVLLLVCEKNCVSRTANESETTGSTIVCVPIA